MERLCRAIGRGAMTRNPGAARSPVPDFALRPAQMRSAERRQVRPWSIWRSPATDRWSGSNRNHPLQSLQPVCRRHHQVFQPAFAPLRRGTR